jgi:hypothetical protein
MIWKKMTDYLKRIKNFLKANTFSENLESSKAKQTSEIELEKIKRDAAVIIEKISRRI